MKSIEFARSFCELWRHSRFVRGIVKCLSRSVRINSRTKRVWKNYFIKGYKRSHQTTPRQSKSSWTVKKNMSSSCGTAFVRFSFLGSGNPAEPYAD